MEKNLLHKNVGEDLTIAMMIKKVETYFGRGPTGQKPRISFFFEVQATCPPASTHEPHQTCRKDALWILPHSTKFQAKILTGKFYFGNNLNIYWVVEQIF